MRGMEAFLPPHSPQMGKWRQVHGNPHDMPRMPQTLTQIVKSDRLPTLPSIALRVIELAREPEPDFREVASVIRTDPALSWRLLRTANSALFGLGKPVTSVESAIPLLETSTPPERRSSQTTAASRRELRPAVQAADH